MVGDYQGWVDDGRNPVCRREVPVCLVPLILDFGAPFRLVGPLYRDGLTRGSFIAGPHDAVSLNQGTGPTACVQVNLTVLGASRLFGRALPALANRVVGLDELLGRAGDDLVAELAEATSWTARFDRVDAFLAARLTRAGGADPGVTWAWRQLARSGGGVAVGDLARSLGWSHARLIDRFRIHTGLPPKTWARIRRFGRVLEAVERGAQGWADVAVDCGYYDQAHLSRDFRELAGTTPTDYLRRRLPDGGGVAAASLVWPG